MTIRTRMNPDRGNTQAEIKLRNGIFLIAFVLPVLAGGFALALMLLSERHDAPVIIYGVLVVAALIGAMAYGLRRGHLQAVREHSRKAST